MACVTLREKKVFDTEKELSVYLSKYVADLSHKFTKQRGVFNVVLSGGSDLIDDLGLLLQEPYVSTVEWRKWHVFWVDERVVPKTSDESNYKYAYDNLLSKVPIPEANIHSINDTLTAEEAAIDYETRIRSLVDGKVIEISPETGFPKFDVILLGMGPDGHVASLFPGHPLIDEKKKWVSFLTDSPRLPPQRITFTFPVINSASFNVLEVTGADKAEAVATAFSSNADSVPAGRVTAQDKLTWLLDKTAASKL